MEHFRRYSIDLHANGSAPSTMWQCISAISKCNETKGIERASSDSIIKSLMIKWTKDHKTKKSKTLSLEDFQTYFSSDVPINNKVAAIIGFE